MNSPFLPEPETDLLWTGPSVRGLLPSATLLLLTSVTLLSAGPWVAGQVGVEHEWATFVLFWLTVGLWVVAGCRWFYRGASYVYRVTDRAVHVDFGFLHRPVPTIPLEDIQEMEHRPWPMWFMAVGTVVIHAAGRPPVALPGLVRPKEFIDRVVTAKKTRDATT